MYTSIYYLLTFAYSRLYTGFFVEILKNHGIRKNIVQELESQGILTKVAKCPEKNTQGHGKSKNSQ